MPVREKRPQEAECRQLLPFSRPSPAQTAAKGAASSPIARDWLVRQTRRWRETDSNPRSPARKVGLRALSSDTTGGCLLSVPAARSHSRDLKQCRLGEVAADEPHRWPQTAGRKTAHQPAIGIIGEQHRPEPGPGAFGIGPADHEGKPNPGNSTASTTPVRCQADSTMD
jgi:hypothetical protein